MLGTTASDYCFQSHDSCIPDLAAIGGEISDQAGLILGVFVGISEGTLPLGLIVAAWPGAACSTSRTHPSPEDI